MDVAKLLKLFFLRLFEHSSKAEVNDFILSLSPITPVEKGRIFFISTPVIEDKELSNNSKSFSPARPVPAFALPALITSNLFPFNFFLNFFKQSFTGADLKLLVVKTPDKVDDFGILTTAQSKRSLYFEFVVAQPISISSNISFPFSISFGFHPPLSSIALAT